MPDVLIWQRSDGGGNLTSSSPWLDAVSSGVDLETLTQYLRDHLRHRLALFASAHPNFVHQLARDQGLQPILFEPSEVQGDSSLPSERTKVITCDTSYFRPSALLCQAEK